MEVCAASSNTFNNFSFMPAVNDQIGERKLTVSGEAKTDVINVFVLL